VDKATRAAIGIWTLAIVCAALAILIVATSDHTLDKVALMLLAVPTELLFVASGILARLRRPQNPTGVLLIAVGFAWFLGALNASDNRYLFTAGLLLGTLFTAVLAHLLLAFPTGRLRARTDRGIVACFYFVVVGLPPIAYVFDEGTLSESVCDGPCPENVLSVAPAQTVATAVAIVYAVSAFVLAALVLVRLVLRWRRASPALRRALAPVLVTAGVLIGLALLQTFIELLSEQAARAFNWVVLAAILTVPLAFLYGLLRSRFAATTRRLVAELSQKRTPAEVQDVLRHALHDPTLELGYRADRGYVDVAGRPLLAHDGDGDRAVTDIGEGILVHDASLKDQPELDEVVDAAHLALERGVSLMSLEASDRRTSALLDAMPDNVYRVRADGTFLDARVKHNVAVFGGAEAFLGRTIRDILPFDVAQRLMEALESVLATGETRRVEYELEHDEGSSHIEARIVRSGEDEVVAITRDVTDLKTSEAALRALAEEQAGLRRVATLAAAVGDREKERVFAAVTEEVGRLLGAQSANTTRFSADGTAVIVGAWGIPGIELFEPGEAIRLDGATVLTQVLRTGAPARVDSYEGLPGPLAARMREIGRRGAVAAPIHVSGRLWGAISAGRTIDEPFPADAEGRIDEFGKIVGIALANAEAREQLAGLAEEQAALSRVAVAVATAARPESVFDVVTEEVARLLGADGANLVRFDAQTEDEGGLVVGRWSEPGIRISPTGARVKLQGGALTKVRRTGRPARGSVGDPGNPPELDERLRELGITSLVAAPIDVSGELWGAVVVSVTGDKTFAAGTEERIGQFARLVAVALANAEAREQLAGLAEEQAALSRVAVAVATEEKPERLFNAVSEEVGLLLGARAAATVRYVEGEDASVIVGGWQRDGRFDRVGVKVPFQGGAIARVHTSGRPGRIDIENAPPDVQEHMAAEEVSSQVAAPIVVSGRLWGATSVSIGPPDRFPFDAEERLGKFTRLVAVALANAEAREQLTASRARIVQAGDAERRRLERNLHDGAQQRLVTLSLSLRLALSKLRDDPAEAQQLLEASASELSFALEELRELARGLHPAILSDRGLGAALEALATRAPMPVELADVPPERLPPSVEAAAYYVVAESLTNVAKYAEARSAHVSVLRRDGIAIVEVEDDGVGGADASRGSGLRGLADRVEALEGRLVVTSETGRGTRVRAEIPCT
jgi:signal transduction histidine kinase/PAS domain-containing protein